MLSSQAPSTKRSTRGVIYAEFRLWSIKHVMCGEWFYLLSQVCLAMLQQNLSWYWKTKEYTTAKFSGQVIAKGKV